MIALSTNLKQLSDRTDIQTLMNENKRLVELNLELKQQVNNGLKDDETSKKSYLLIFAIIIIAVIAGTVFGRVINI